MSSRAKVREIHRRLVSHFGPLKPPRVWDPLDELIYTVLSQNTSDVNSTRAFASLRDRFSDWRQVVDARTSDVAAAIRSGGLANTKAPRIQAILREIWEREGRFDLSWMKDATDERVIEYLSDLSGVGPKTVACVLAFALGRDAMPVDTHVHRVAGRLGLVPPKASADAAHRVLRDEIPPELRVQMHVGMVKLGREVCRAQRPRCSGCPLLAVCPTGTRLSSTDEAGRGRDLR